MQNTTLVYYLCTQKLFNTQNTLFIMKNFTFKREWMEEMVALPDDFRARIILAANDYAYFDKLPDDPIVAYAMRHIIAYIERRKSAKNRSDKRASHQVKSVATEVQTIVKDKPLEVDPKQAIEEREDMAPSIIPDCSEVVLTVAGDDEVAEVRVPESNVSESNSEGSAADAHAERLKDNSNKTAISSKIKKDKSKTTKANKSSSLHAQKRPKTNSERGSDKTLTFRDFKRMKRTA